MRAMLLALSSFVLASPLDGPGAVADAAARAAAADVILGAPTNDPWLLLRRAGEAPHHGLYVLPGVNLSFGDGVPENLGGDAEPGLFTPTISAAVAGVYGPLHVRATPGSQLAVSPGVTPKVDVRDFWAGVHTGGLSVGFGRQDRWLGPGRHGSLTLSDNAVPPWMGGLSAEGRLPFFLSKLGRLRGELQVGWLAEARGDVTNPGFMLIDVRWLPVPMLELGVTRMTMFGGKDRPPVDVGQLLLPTEPHIYNDPDLLLPDQNELASIDVRLCLPIQRWLPNLPITSMETYWQYGGEDVIGREIGPIPYPSLAGVANVYGGETVVGPITINAEYAKLMDDTFRWYVGHRVYHEGFTQNGRPMGYFSGTDSEVMWGRVAYRAERFSVAVSGDYAHRVGVIESRNHKVFTLGTDEQRYRATVEGALRTPAVGRFPAGTITGGYTIGRVTGEDFRPSEPALEHRVWLGWQGELAFGPDFARVLGYM